MRPSLCAKNDKLIFFNCYLDHTAQRMPDLLVTEHIIHTHIYQLMLHYSQVPFCILFIKLLILNIPYTFHLILFVANYSFE